MITKDHQPAQFQSLRYCVVCSAARYDSGLAHHKTTYKCSIFTTLLCLAIQFRQKILSVWYQKRNLRPRKQLKVHSIVHHTEHIVEDSVNGGARTGDDMTDVSNATPARDTVLYDGRTSAIHTYIDRDTNEMKTDRNILDVNTGQQPDTERTTSTQWRRQISRDRLRNRGRNRSS